MNSYKITTVNTNTIGEHGTNFHCGVFEGENEVNAKQVALDECGDYHAIVSCVPFVVPEEEWCKVDCYPDGENEDNRFDN